MRLVVLLTAAAFGLSALSTNEAFAQATPMSGGQMESAGKPAKAAVKSKRSKKKSSKKMSQ
jgi:hypothetical protein